MRAGTDADADANPHADGNPNSNSDPYTDCNPNPRPYTNRNPDPLPYTNSHATDQSRDELSDGHPKKTRRRRAADARTNMCLR